MKVLVADDDAVSRAILDKLLRRIGYEPVLAAGGREALGQIKREEIPLLITDWQMPEIDGPELCRRLRAPGRKVYTYIVLLTTLSGRSRFLEGLSAGADDFLTKPVDGDELAARLKVGERIVGLQRDLRRMEGLLSICMHCKKIRQDTSWVPVDEYITHRTAASFSHSLCPECMKRQIES
jgi:DNA-binding response OmpR family regulator